MTSIWPRGDTKVSQANEAPLPARRSSDQSQHHLRRLSPLSCDDTSLALRGRDLVSHLFPHSAPKCSMFIRSTASSMIHQAPRYPCPSPTSPPTSSSRKAPSRDYFLSAQSWQSVSLMCLLTTRLGQALARAKRRWASESTVPPTSSSSRQTIGNSKASTGKKTCPCLHVLPLPQPYG